MTSGRRLSFLLAVWVATAGTRALAQTPPLGDEVPVNAFTTGDERRPAVVLDPLNGSFAVAWERPGIDIAGRAFHEDGTPSSGEALVNTYTTGYQVLARAAGDPEKQFIVVWESGGQDGDFAGIFAAAL